MLLPTLEPLREQPLLTALARSLRRLAKLQRLAAT
jgi:hypothetical protein